MFPGFILGVEVVSDIISGLSCTAASLQRFENTFCLNFFLSGSGKWGRVVSLSCSLTGAVSEMSRACKMQSKTNIIQKRLFLKINVINCALSRKNTTDITGTTVNFGFDKVNESEKKHRVQTVFENVANKYDLMNDAMSFYIHRLWKDYYVSKLQIHKNSTIIDVAGGTGDIAFRIINRLRDLPHGDGSVCVVDINEKMLNVGKLRASNLFDWETNKKRLSWFSGDAESLPFQDNTFDFYTIAFGIRNCTHVDKVLSEAYRVLKPKGVFTCMEFGHVKQSVIRKFYDVYSFQLIPTIGHLIVGDYNSYKYLVESIRVFPEQDKFGHMIKIAGFKNVSYEELSFGVCNIFVGIK